MIDSGDYKQTREFLNRLRGGSLFSDLDSFGQRGVEALAAATPQETGLTAQSWRYRIIKDARGPGIEWHNTNMENGVPVAILIQYGHGTGTGGYVQGVDYINPVIRPIFDEIANNVWEKVRL